MVINGGCRAELLVLAVGRERLLRSVHSLSLSVDHQISDWMFAVIVYMYGKHGCK